MKKYWRFIVMWIAGLALVACSDDDSNSWYLPVDEAWREANVNAFEQRANDEGIEYINSQSNNGRILYKVLKKGEGTEQIYYTSQVECYYKGCFIADEDGNYIQNRDSVLSQGEVFDSALRENDDDPALMTGGATINYGNKKLGTTDGFATALQHMHVGDVWEVWIPYSLGYGVNGNVNGTDTIKPYTTLVYQIEVADIVEQ